jgi:heat shock protein HtpX
MKFAKRIFLFMAVNLLIVTTISIIMSVFNVQPYLTAQGIDYQSLLVFCAIWGFGGALISLAISKMMAKWMMGVKIIDPRSQNFTERNLVEKVHSFSKKAGLSKMPEVGIYESPVINAFATGPSKNNSLVAVSTGLLDRMSEAEVDGVLAHEVAHIANGDMVTMTLVQAVVNTFVMFIARIAGFFVSQLVEEEKRPMVQFGVVLVLEILLGILGMLVVSYVSRAREFRADDGGAKLAGRDKMIAALEKLKQNAHLPSEEKGAALASLQISGKRGKFLQLFSTHPDLDDRIRSLQRNFR